MKVEKCPRCDQVPTFHQSQYSDVIPQTVVKCGCGTVLQWGLTWQVKMTHNRWARREAKRIAREGAKNGIK